MRPHALALLLLLFALAQAGPGAWSAGAASPWIVTPFWLVAMCGALVAALALFGLRRLQPIATVSAFAATFASAALLHLAGAMAWSAAYLGIGAVLAFLTRWWARCSHPEIHTRTVCTRSDIEVTDVPTPWDRIGATLAYGFLLLTAALIVVRPWHQQWGASVAELGGSFSYEDAADAPRHRVDRAVSIAAPPEQVWPWLAQIGQDRAGFYSYDWLERAFGDDVHNADSLVPAWQERQVGDFVRAAQPSFLSGRLGDSLGWRITSWDPPRTMSLDRWGTFVIASAGPDSSRLIVHERGGGRPHLAALPLAVVSFYLVEPAHFVMERGMLLGIKARAESSKAVGG